MDKKPIRVLLIEDNPADVVSLETALHKDPRWTYRVAVAKRSSAGLQMIEREHFDVVLLDLNLPDSQGLETYVQLKPALSGLPTIVLSGLLDEMISLRAVQMGAQDYVVKGGAGWETITRTIHYAMERQEAQNALRASEIRHRSLFENITNGLAHCQMLYDADGAPVDFVYLNVNPAFKQIIGLPEVVGKRVSELIPSLHESNPEVFEIYGRVARQGGSDRFETFAPSLGAGVWFSVSVFSPQPDQFVAVFEDITERKESEHGLRDSEARFRMLFENSPVAIWEEDFSKVKSRLDEIKNGGVTDLDSYFTEHPEAITQCLDLIVVQDVNQAGLQLYEAANKPELLGGLQKTLSVEAIRGFKRELLAVARDESRLQAETMLITFRGNLRNVTMDWVVAAGYERTYSKVLVSLTDITERRIAEEQLRHSESKYRTLAENSVQGIAIFQQSRIIYVNPAMCEIMGYPMEELLTMTRDQILNLTYPDDRPGSQKLVERREAGEVLQSWNEIRILRQDGTIRWIQNFVSPIQYDGQPALLSTCIDITERKQAEQKYQAIFENSAQGIFQSTLDGRFIKVNPAMARIYGYDSPQEMIETITDIAQQIYLDPAERFEFTRLFQVEGSIQHFEMRNRRKDGQVIWTSTSARGVYDSEGQLLYYEGFLEDITERKQAEQRVKESERRFRTLIENGLDYISLLDAQGNLLWESPSTSSLLGYAYAEFLQRNIFELMHPDDLGWTSQLFHELVQQPGQRQSGTFRLERKDGSWCWVEAIASNYLSEPSVHAIVINYRDITERKLSEEKLRENEERLHVALRAVDLAVFNQNLDLHYTWIYQPQLGYSVKDVVGRTDVELLPTNDAHQIMAIKQRVIETGHGAHEEVFVHTPKKTLVYDLILEPVIDSTGIVTGLTGATLDITERKQAELELQLKNDDLALINLINEAVIQSQSLETVINLLADGLKHHFNSQVCAVYVLSSDGKSLVTQQLWFEPLLKRQIEQEIGGTIPLARLPIREGGYFQKILRADHGLIFNQPQEIVEWLVEFGEVQLLPAATKANLHGRMQQIYQVMNINSTIGLPLIAAGGNSIGILHIARSNLFTEEDRQRLEAMARQLTAAIQRQQADERVRSSEGFLNSVQNALSAHLAILDEAGTIVRVNSAWRKFGEQNGYTHPDFGIGVNYLAVCDSAYGPNSEESAAVAAAIRDVLVGRKTEAQVEYPCHSSEQQRWFILRVTKFQDGDRMWAVLAHENITVRKKMEEKVRESEASLAEAQTIAKMGSWRFDLTTNTVVWSAELYRIFELEPSEFGGLYESLLGRVYPEDQPRVLETNRMAQEKGEAFEIEYRIQTPSGQLKYIREIGYGIQDPNQQITRLLGVAQDITQRKQAELELQLSEERYRDLINQLPVMVYTDEFAGAMGRTQFISPQIEVILGFSPAEWLAGGIDLWQSQLHPEDRERVTAQYLSCVKTGKIFESDYRIRSKAGQTLWLHDQFNTFYDSEGTPVSTHGIAYNITERKQAEENLRESEARFVSAFEYAPIGKSIVALDGHWLKVNPALCEILGYLPEELMHLTFQVLTHPDDLAIDLELVAHLLAGKIKTYQLEKRYKHKQGHFVWALLNVSLVRDQLGTPLYFISQIQDITERRKSEEDIRRRVAELEALYENGLAISRLLDPKLISAQVVEVLADKLQWHHAAVRLYNPETNHFEVVALNHPGSSADQLREQIGYLNAVLSDPHSGMTGWVVKQHLPLRTADLHSDPRYVETYPGMCSGLYVPILAGERVLGTISAESELEEAFSPQDERLLMTLASQAAVAIENAQLYLLVQRELDERQQAEVRLRESEARQNGIIEAAMDAIITVDDSQNIVLFNTAAEIIFGCPVAEALGQPLERFIPIRFREAHREHLKKFGETGITTRNMNSLGEVLGQRMDGSEFPLEASISQITVAGVKLYTIILHDITERKRAEDELRQSEEKYRRLAAELEQRVAERTVEVQDLYDNAPCGYHSLDEHGRIIRVNETELNWLGYTREELLGQPFTAFLTEESQQVFFNNFPVFKERGSIRDLELDLLCQDGSTLPVVISATVVYNTAGNYLTSRSTLFDNTERKIALEALRLANTEMKRALRTKDEFLANMSHELRTPLNAILGLSESLLEQTAGPLNERQHRYLTTINESGSHLLTLINDILDLAKVEAGQIKLEPAKVDINSVCQASLRLIKQLAQKKNQTVEIQIEKNIGSIWADERRLKQMIVNLLSNAVKFTTEGGKLGLEAQINPGDSQLLITVWDQGIGIRNEDLPHLFQPFVQLDSGLSRESGGTGLGLALVAQMARLHGGRVSVFSAPKQGSRFTIVLPWDPAITNDTLEKFKITGRFPTLKQLPNRARTILLVEDTDSVIMLVKDYLELAGYKMEVARDGVEGVSKAIAQQPDLILMDVQMPGLDGLEATRRIRQESSLHDTPIIALTALAMMSDRERCLEAGMSDYLSKPINLRELVKLIQQHLADFGSEMA